MKIIFLDIDGVLNGHQLLPNGYYGIRWDNVQHLNAILDTVPDAKIVVISAWRYMVSYMSMAPKGFENLLLTHGVNANGRVLDVTPTDEQIGGTHDNSRPDQISYWCKENGFNFDLDKHVILDDMPWTYRFYKKFNFIQTDGSKGLQAEHVGPALKFLS